MCERGRGRASIQGRTRWRRKKDKPFQNWFRERNDFNWFLVDQWLICESIHHSAQYGRWAVLEISRQNSKQKKMREFIDFLQHRRSLLSDFYVWFVYWFALQPFDATKKGTDAVRKKQSPSCGKYWTISIAINVYSVDFSIFVHFTWFTFKLDHLCLLHLIASGDQLLCWLGCSSNLLIYIVRKRCSICSQCGWAQKPMAQMLLKDYGFAVLLIILIWRSLHSYPLAFVWPCTRLHFQPIPQINN